jgi:hypothetical protein
MYARVGKIPGNHVEQVLEFLKKAPNDGLEETKGVYVLVDEKKAKTMTITLWETKEKAEASLPAAKKIFKEIEKITGMPVEVEHFEVAFQQ